MKRTLLFLAAAALMASCSAPKYTYNFDHYNYNAGKKKSAVANELSSNDGPQAIQPEMLTASTEVVIIEPRTSTVENKLVATKKANDKLTKSQLSELRNSIKQLKKVIKTEKKNIKSSSSTSAIDHDLKLAAIFGAVGIVGLILGTVSSVFWAIGGIAMLIGVVFFVIWLTKQ